MIVKIDLIINHCHFRQRRTKRLFCLVPSNTEYPPLAVAPGYSAVLVIKCNKRSINSDDLVQTKSDSCILLLVFVIDIVVH